MTKCVSGPLVHHKFLKMYIAPIALTTLVSSVVRRFKFPMQPHWHDMYSWKVYCAFGKFHFIQVFEVGVNYI